MQRSPAAPWYQNDPRPAGSGSASSGEAAASVGTGGSASCAATPRPVEPAPGAAPDDPASSTPPISAAPGEAWLENPPTRTSAGPRACAVQAQAAARRPRATGAASASRPA